MDGPGPEAESQARRAAKIAWAKMIRKVYEVDPLTCPECGAQAPVTSAMEPWIFMLRPSSKGRDLSEVLTALARWGKKHVRGTVVPAEFRKKPKR